jgi:hypothetical protein
MLYLLNFAAAIAAVNAAVIIANGAPHDPLSVEFTAIRLGLDGLTFVVCVALGAIIRRLPAPPRMKKSEAAPE